MREIKTHARPYNSNSKYWLCYYTDENLNTFSTKHESVDRPCHEQIVDLFALKREKFKLEYHDWS